jgi:hypothetical protein
MQRSIGNTIPYVIVPEESIRSAARYMGDEDNSFTLVLEKVEAFRNADMTPLVLMNTYDYSVYVVAIETYNKKLH